MIRTIKRKKNKEIKNEINRIIFEVNPNDVLKEGWIIADDNDGVGAGGDEDDGDDGDDDGNESEGDRVMVKYWEENFNTSLEKLLPLFCEDNSLWWKLFATSILSVGRLAVLSSLSGILKF